MAEPEEPHQLYLELLQNSLPYHVTNHLNDIMDDMPNQNMMQVFYPVQVIDEVVTNMQQANIVTNQNVQSPLNYNLDCWLRYKDKNLERNFQVWEAKHTRRQMLIFALILFKAFLFHIIMSSNMEEMQWPTGTVYTFILCIILIWLPVITALLPISWLLKYKDIICAIHQILFGITVVEYLHYCTYVLKKPVYNLFDPTFFCFVPVFFESVLLKVRLKYHFPLNALLITMTSSPWLIQAITNTNDPINYFSILHIWIVSFFVTVVTSSCLISLYEYNIRKQYETFSKTTSTNNNNDININNNNNNNIINNNHPIQ